MQQDPVLRSRARQLRREPTAAEHRLWQALRGDAIGTRFTRQHVVGPYIADLAARRARLIVEIDGDTHASQLAYDAGRTAFLERRGYRVLRFGNGDVMGNLEGVVAVIVAELASRTSPHPGPPPGGGREQPEALPPRREGFGGGPGLAQRS